MRDDDRDPIELDADMRDLHERILERLHRHIDVDAGLDEILQTGPNGHPAPLVAGTPDGAAQSQPQPLAVETVIDQPPTTDTARKRTQGDDGPDRVTPVSLVRIAEALERLDIRYLTDGDRSLLALWERHAVLFALEGPADEILVVRARPHATVPPTWADRAYRVANEWNHTRRFYKAYVGDPTDRGQLPVYAEMQIPLMARIHDALLLELIDCAAVVAMGFVDWLHDEGGLL
jgi:hypothetical protein